MCPDVARSQQRQCLVHSRGRHVYVRHDRHIEFVRDFTGDFHRAYATRSARLAPDAHFDSHDNVAITPNRVDTSVSIKQAKILAFADLHIGAESKYSRVRNIEECQDTQLCTIDDKASKAGKIARARASSVDECSSAARAAHGSGVHAERGTPPINMRVEVD